MQQRISLVLGTCGGIFGTPVGCGCVRRTASCIVDTATKHSATKAKSPSENKVKIPDDEKTIY